MWECSAMYIERKPRSSRARPRAAGPMPSSVMNVATPNLMPPSYPIDAGPARLSGRGGRTTRRGGRGDEHGDGVGGDDQADREPVDRGQGLAEEERTDRRREDRAEAHED